MRESLQWDEIWRNFAVDKRLWHCDMWREGFSDMGYAGGMENDVTGRFYNNYIITYYIYCNIYNK